MLRDRAVLSMMIEGHPHDVSGRSSPVRFPFGFMMTRKIAQVDERHIRATTIDQFQVALVHFGHLEPRQRVSERAMRDLNALSLARKKYHESIGFDHSRFPEGHTQVEYPPNPSRQASRSRNAPSQRFPPPTLAKPSTDPAEDASSVTDSKSLAQQPNPLIDMKLADQKASASQYLDKSGKLVQGYESHCSSSEPRKHKQRPIDIVTQKTWQKVWPTIIERSPILSDQAAGNDNTDRGGETSNCGAENA